MLAGQGVTGRVRMLAVVVLLVAVGSGFLVAGGGGLDAYQRSGSEKVETAQKTASDTLDLPTVEEARPMIVGTWIEDVASEVGSHRKGAKKWVFTDGGTVRKYRDGELYAKQDYEIVQRYDEMQDPDEIVGYLKFTRPSGEVYYATLTNIERGEDPILYVKHHGPSVPATLLVPPNAFE